MINVIEKNIIENERISNKGFASDGISIVEIPKKINKLNKRIKINFYTINSFMIFEQL